jgi:hypothetical protein
MIRSNRGKFGGYDNAAEWEAYRAINRCETIDDIIKTVNGPRVESDRYYKLNMTAFWRHRTIEFRQHSGTVDADKAINWIRLLIQFVNRAAKSRQRPYSPNVKKPCLGTIFWTFFRTFKMEELEGLKEFYLARRKLFHGGAPSEAEAA